MTVRALLGLATANAVVIVPGSCLLWGVRGLRSWAELLRLSGAAYMTGVAALGVALSIELILGVPFRLATVILTCLALTVAGLMLGRALGREHPFARAGSSEGIGLVAAAYGALVVSTSRRSSGRGVSLHCPTTTAGRSGFPRPR